MADRVFYRIKELSDGKKRVFDVWRIEERHGWIRNRERESYCGRFSTAEEAKLWVFEQPATTKMHCVNHVGDFMPDGSKVNCGFW